MSGVTGTAESRLPKEGAGIPAVGRETCPWLSTQLKRRSANVGGS